MWLLPLRASKLLRRIISTLSPLISREPSKGLSRQLHSGPSLTFSRLGSKRAPLTVLPMTCFRPQLDAPFNVARVADFKLRRLAPLDLLDKGERGLRRQLRRTRAVA